jgi:ribosomal protein S18 acetylase RimI-like enzyme
MVASLIRPATVADAGILADLGARTFRETFAAICSADDLEAYVAGAYGEAIQAAELADPDRPGLVLEVDGLPAGFVQMRLGHREPGVPGSRPTELQRIYVLRAHHRGGWGTALMDAGTGLALAWGADVLWLGVWEHNDRALAFYARHGFREVGEHIFRIGGQVDRDLILAKGLP